MYDAREMPLDVVSPHSASYGLIRTCGALLLLASVAGCASHPTDSNKPAVEDRIKFRSLAIGGMSIRNWYYLLRDVDPDRHRFRAVVIGLERYTDDEHPDTPPDRIRDLMDLCWNVERLPDASRIARAAAA